MHCLYIPRSRAVILPHRMASWLNTWHWRSVRKWQEASLTPHPWRPTWTFFPESRSMSPVNSTLPVPGSRRTFLSTEMGNRGEGGKKSVQTLWNSPELVTSSPWLPLTRPLCLLTSSQNYCVLSKSPCSAPFFGSSFSFEGSHVPVKFFLMSMFFSCSFVNWIFSPRQGPWEGRGSLPLP